MYIYVEIFVYQQSGEIWLNKVKPMYHRIMCLQKPCFRGEGTGREEVEHLLGLQMWQLGMLRKAWPL